MADELDFEEVRSTKPSGSASPAGESDSERALAVGRSHYSDLLEAGVKIYESQNVVLHSKTAVIDGVLEHSPAEHVRRPTVPAESPTLGLTHLQLEALLTAARLSPNRPDS